MNPILVEVYRNKVLESFHRGVVCVVDNDGEIIYSEGDVKQICYPRSAMKFLQVLPLIENGGISTFNFTLEEIAVMCGSHNAEQEHLRVVNSILQKIGLDKEKLFCGPQYPSSKKDADELIRKNEKPHHIHNNCSGKHAGMLALCVLLKVSVEDYINPNHPIQKLILDVCAEMYEYEKEKIIIAKDGCSAPIFSIPVYNQAVGFKNIVSPEKFSDKRNAACKIVVEAISKYTFMVAGSKRYCSDMMQICAPQIIGKTGAEGIFCLGLTKEKVGVCIKIDDGKMLPQYNVAQAFIEATNIFTEEKLLPLHHYMDEELYNFNKFVIGEINVREGLFKNLNLRKN
jgi:L-asparaginase II